MRLHSGIESFLTPFIFTIGLPYCVLRDPSERALNIKLVQRTLTPGERIAVLLVSSFKSLD